MRPSEVRECVLAEHAALRERLDSLSALCADLEGGKRWDVAPALGAAQSLRSELEDHFALEDATLGPALRARDSWGVVRAGNLEQHHRVQREQLQILSATGASAQTPVSIARALLVLIDELRVDMAYEERELLTREILCDDIETSDGEDG